MTTATLGQLIDKYGFDVHDHLDRDLEIPVHAGLQAQGDLFIIPADPNHDSPGAPVPLDGIPVIEAVGGGHEHRLFAGQPGTAFFTPAGAGSRTSGSSSAPSPLTSLTLSTPTPGSPPGPTSCAGSGNKPIGIASSPIRPKFPVRRSNGPFDMKIEIFSPNGPCCLHDGHLASHSGEACQARLSPGRS